MRLCTVCTHRKGNLRDLCHTRPGAIYAGDLQDLMTAPQDLSEPAYMEVMPLADAAADAPDAPADPAPNAAFSADAAAKYDAVMEFCLNRGQVLFTTLMTEFVNIHLGDLERYITSKLCCNVGQSYCICYSLHGQKGPLCCIYLSRLLHNIPCTKYSSLQQQNYLAAWQCQDKGCLQCAMTLYLSFSCTFGLPHHKSIGHAVGCSNIMHTCSLFAQPVTRHHILTLLHFCLMAGSFRRWCMRAC